MPGAGVSCRPWRGGAPACSPVEHQPHLLFPGHGRSFWIQADSGSTLSFCLQRTRCMPQWGRECLGSSSSSGSAIRAARMPRSLGSLHTRALDTSGAPSVKWDHGYLCSAGAGFGEPDLGFLPVRGLTFLTVLGSSHLGVSWRRAGEREPSMAWRSLIPDPGRRDQPVGRRVCRWLAASARFLAGWAARRVLDTADLELEARLPAAPEPEGSPARYRGLGPRHSAESSALILNSTS